MRTNAMSCPLCEVERRVNNIGKYRSKSSIFANKKLFKCSECGIIFINPMPTEREINDYYNEVWLNDEDITSTSEDAKTVFKVEADMRIRYLMDHIMSLNNMKVLDFGGGFGYLYDSIKKKGIENIKYYATELNIRQLNRMKSKGIQAYSQINDTNIYDFDLVALCHVLEHIREPMPFMRMILSHIKIGGYIFIDLPERDDSYKEYLEPHLTVFTIESLTKLADRLGLNIVHINGYGNKRETITRNKNIISRIFNKVSMFINHRDKRSMSMYEYYKNYYEYEIEGRERRWIRAIMQKGI